MKHLSDEEVISMLDKLIDVDDIIPTDEDQLDRIEALVKSVRPEEK